MMAAANSTSKGRGLDRIGCCIPFSYTKEACSVLIDGLVNLRGLEVNEQGGEMKLH